MRFNPDGTIYRIRISQLIAELQEVMAREGDLPVVYEWAGQVCLGFNELDGQRVLDLARGDD